MTTPAGDLQLPAYFEVQATLNKSIEGVRTARGTVIEQCYFGLNFKDHFRLLKTDQGWVIVDKLFHHEPPQQ